jgi:hypothetical protein
LLLHCYIKAALQIGVCQVASIEPSGGVEYSLIVYGDGEILRTAAQAKKRSEKE